jgi:hypothetical protein
LEVKWRDVKGTMRETLANAKGLLDRMLEQRGMFVATDAYMTLTRAMASRSSLLQRMDQVRPPLNWEEVAELGRVHDAYVQLRLNLQLAIRQLNAYIATL